MSISATARVTGHARHTIARWLERASTAAKRFNQRMLRDVAIIELQADALCTFIGNKSRATGLCAAIEVCSRLWAGSVLGRRASRNATAVLHDVILRGRVVGFPLIATDGFEYYVGVIERLFGSACVSGHVLKTRRNDRVGRVERRRRIGTAGRLQAARWESEDSETLHTSFVERLTLTIRQGSKNPHSHRSVTIESTEAAEMIVLASHLLGIVDKRSSNDSAALEAARHKNQAGV